MNEKNNIAKIKYNFYKKILTLSSMIEFEKISDKGEKLKAYTHRNYLSHFYNSEICRLQKRNQTYTNVIFYGTTIVSYWALNNISSLNNFVSKKFSWKGKFLIVSALIGAVDSFVASVILTSSLRSSHQSLLKKESFPAWFKKTSVINPDRVFFELDDNHNNEPTIYHSGITHQAIRKLTPDFIVGTAHKPHVPIAEIHHH